MDFEAMYKARYMQVYSFCLTLTRDASLAEEITQDTFYRALVAIREKGDSAGFDGRSAELTWLCAIAKNRFADEMRRRGRQAPPDPDALESALGEAVADDDPPAEAADKDASLRIHKILHAMEEPYKEVFSLRVFGELSFAQIGELFGKTETWARVTYHRAKLKIQERMDSHESKL